jgi:hypothetical protein
MIVMKAPIVYSPPMILLTVAFVPHLNKKEDPVVETRTLNIKNNVILPVNVDILAVIVLYLEHARIEPQNKPQFH